MPDGLTQAPRTDVTIIDDPADTEHRRMTDQLLPFEERATDADFIGFDGAQLVEPVPIDEGKKPALPAVVKPPRRKAKKARKRVTVRVSFDERELTRLNKRAAEAGVELAEYLRLRALRDPRPRARVIEPSGRDLFARAEIIQTTTVRLITPLSPELEQRIATYFCPPIRLGPQPVREARPALSAAPRPVLVGKMAQRLTAWVVARWPRHRAAPPVRT